MKKKATTEQSSIKQREITADQKLRIDFKISSENHCLRDETKSTDNIKQQEVIIQGIHFD